MRWDAPGADVLALKPDTPGADAEDPGDEIEHGGLARAVGTDEPHQLAGEKLKRKYIQGPQAAEIVGEFSDFQNWLHAFYLVPKLILLADIFPLRRMPHKS